LTLWLQSLGARIVGAALAPTSDPSLFAAAAVSTLCEHHVVDIRDQGAVDDVVGAVQPDVVFHLAAQAIVRESYTQPVDTFAVNALGTAHVLDALRRLANPRSVIIVTSDKCYENLEWVWPYREDDRLGGNDPYSASKACTELITAAYRSSYFAALNIPVSTVRAGNVIGGGDWSAGRLVPDIIRAFDANAPLELRFPDAIRPWQFVLEPLRGYILLAERQYTEPELAQAWNFGPPSEHALSVSKLVEAMMHVWGDTQPVTREDGDKPHEHATLLLDANKARHVLGVRSLLDAQATCSYTATWYKRWRAGENAHTLCMNQIEQYTQLAQMVYA
jgi:CDP-glucose 4,6-dehydratase